MKSVDSVRFTETEVGLKSREAVGTSWAGGLSPGPSGLTAHAGPSASGGQRQGLFPALDRGFRGKQAPADLGHVPEGAVLPDQPLTFQPQTPFLHPVAERVNQDMGRPSSGS